jgi:hypothetical protein
MFKCGAHGTVVLIGNSDILKWSYFWILYRNKNVLPACDSVGGFEKVTFWHSEKYMSS